ncbi:hypothetical protein niasHT_028318 [Heterodera trifolii]|uniref:Uncharacterized protein n=1 Tax=Heterodera trifolii TaxID=157864 RepID=A0ABD2JN86_9BILA
MFQVDLAAISRRFRAAPIGQSPILSLLVAVDVPLKKNGMAHPVFAERAIRPRCVKPADVYRFIFAGLKMETLELDEICAHEQERKRASFEKGYLPKLRGRNPGDWTTVLGKSGAPRDFGFPPQHYGDEHTDEEKFKGSFYEQELARVRKDADDQSYRHSRRIIPIKPFGTLDAQWIDNSLLTYRHAFDEDRTASDQSADSLPKNGPAAPAVTTPATLPPISKTQQRSLQQQTAPPPTLKTTTAPPPTLKATNRPSVNCKDNNTPPPIVKATTAPPPPKTNTPVVKSASVKPTISAPPAQLKSTAKAPPPASVSAELAPSAPLADSPPRFDEGEEENKTDKLTAAKTFS